MSLKYRSCSLLAIAWQLISLAGLGKQDSYKPTKVAGRKEGWDPLL